MSWRMCGATASARGAEAAGFLLSDHSERTTTPRDPHGREPRSAQSRQLVHYGCDRPTVGLVSSISRHSLEILLSSGRLSRRLARPRLLCLHPFVGTRHLDCHPSVPYVQG